MLFNFLTQIGTLMCILLFFVFLFRFIFCFYLCFFFFFFLKRRCKRPTNRRVRRTSAGTAAGVEQSCTHLQDVGPFLNGDEILPIRNTSYTDTSRVTWLRNGSFCVHNFELTVKFWRQSKNL